MSLLGCSEPVATRGALDQGAGGEEAADDVATDESSDDLDQDGVDAEGEDDPDHGDGDADVGGDADDDGDRDSDNEGDDEQPTVDAGAGDLHPPSVPAGLRVEREDPCSQVTIAWDASKADPEGHALRGYQLYVNGVHRFTTLTTEQQIQLLSFTYAAGTTYTLSVAAYAEDGAVSAESAPLSYTPGTCSDAPEPPANVIAQVRDCREVLLSWDAASEAGPGDGIHGYEVRRDGVYLGPVSGTSYTDFGMSAGETHRYTINTRSNQARASDAVHLDVTLPVCTDTAPPSVPENLRQAPGATSNCLSVGTTWDAATDDERVHHYNLYRDGIALEASQDTHGQTDIFMAPSVEYRFEVTAVDAAGNESARSNGFTFEPVCAKLTSPLRLRTALVLGNFADGAEQPFSLAQAEQTVFGAQDSFARYMGDVSHGLIEVSGSSFGWYTLPRNVGSYCPDPGNISCSGHDRDLMSAAAGDLGSASFDRYIRAYAGIGESGFGGGNSMDLSAGSLDVGTIAHEMGHTWGLMHAGDLECSAGEVTAPNLLDLTQGGCVYSRYGDSHDAMGAGHTAYFSTFNREVLGVLGSDRVAVAELSGTYTLTPAALEGSGLKELRIPLEVNGFFYFLEYRKPIGFDATGEGVRPVDGVQVRLHSGGGTGDITTQLLHVLINPDSPFYDRYRRIRVEVVDKTEDAVTLRVTR